MNEKDITIIKKIAEEAVFAALDAKQKTAYTQTACLTEPIQKAKNPSPEPLFNELTLQSVSLGELEKLVVEIREKLNPVLLQNEWSQIGIGRVMSDEASDTAKFIAENTARLSNVINLLYALSSKISIK